MSKKIWEPLVFSFAAAAFALAPWVLRADVNGADPGLTGAPGESTCISCHSGTLNGSSGSVKIVLAGAATYTPGAKQHITVQVADSAQRRWGFELTARASNNNAQAGTLTASDSNSQVKCGTGRATTCTSTTLQFATHTLAGTRLGTSNGASFEIDWTPPATDVGNIILYATGNAANGNNSESGDHIYSTSLTLTPAASTTAPAISSTSGVVNGASYQAGIGPRTWITIRGTNLSSTTREWTSADMTNGLPTSLDGVSVSVNGKAAYVRYISPTQINALTTADSSQGPVQVTVTSNGATSSAATVQMSSVSPALFTFDGTYAAATHADASFLGKTGLFASAPSITTPAKAGETIVLYGTGFGAVSPAVSSGKLVDQLASISGNLKVTVGGVDATVLFGGLVPGFADLYQFNVTLPASLGSGDQTLLAEVDGVSAPSVQITVQ